MGALLTGFGVGDERYPFDGRSNLRRRRCRLDTGDRSRRRGIAFRLIDRIDALFQGARGKAIQPRSQEVFEDLGIVDRVVAAGGPYPPQRVYRDDGSYQDSLMMEDRDAR